MNAKPWRWWPDFSRRRVNRPAKYLPTDQVPVTMSGDRRSQRSAMPGARGFRVSTNQPVAMAAAISTLDLSE